jgi:hypothetical protein
MSATAYDISAEEALLGGMMMMSPAVIAACEDLNPTHFSPPHDLIFSAIAELHRTGKPVLPRTVTTELQERGKLEAAGGAVYVSGLTYDGTTGAASAAYFAGVLREKWTQRRTCEIAAQLHREVENGGTLAAFDKAMELVGKLRAQSNGSAPALVPLMDISAGEPDPRKTVLGNRFLCIGGGMLFVGPSGIGKSSASVQQDVLWSLGRPAFGIRPARPLRILTIQAENDAEDLAEMRDGVCRGLGLSDADRQLVRGRVFYESEQSKTGAEFLAYADKRLAMAQFDLLRIDPFLAYLGADVNNAEQTAAFLRNGLNPILTRRAVACILNHHTPKVVNRDTSNWRGSDWMYSGAGSADITNWTRAALVIDPTHAPGVFKLIAAKREYRIGWVDADGERETLRHYCHASDGLYWREATDDDLAAVEAAAQAKKQGKTVKTAADLKAHVPTVGAIPKVELLEKARGSGFSKHLADAALKELLETGAVFRWEIKRKGTNPEVRISRQEQTLSEVSA